MYTTTKSGRMCQKEKNHCQQVCGQCIYQPNREFERTENTSPAEVEELKGLSPSRAAEAAGQHSAGKSAQLGAGGAGPPKGTSGAWSSNGRRKFLNNLSLLRPLALSWLAGLTQGVFEVCGDLRGAAGVRYCGKSNRHY